MDEINFYGTFDVLQLRNQLKESMKNENFSTSAEVLLQINNSRDVNDPNCSYTDLLKEALLWASQYGHTDGVAKILEFGIDPNYTDTYNNTAVLLASEKGHLDIVKLLLMNDCNVKRPDSQTRTALHWSSMNGHHEIVQLLLLHGAVADERDILYGYTPLMLAARQGHQAILKTLLERNCDPNQKDIHQETALFDAVRNGHNICAKMLINAGAQCNQVGHFGKTLMLTAVLWNRLSSVAMLVKMNCKLNVPGATQYVQSRFTINGDNKKMLVTPIEAALMEGKKDICNILFLAGADITMLYKYLEDSMCDDFVKSFIGQNISNGDIIPWLNKIFKAPRSLKECTRIIIREYCTDGQALNHLPLPKSLIEFMHIPEINEFL